MEAFTIATFKICQCILMTGLPNLILAKVSRYTIVVMHVYIVLSQWQIIPLLSKAINHFKSHRSERMIALLKVLLAEEYYHVRQYDNALT